MAEEEKIRNGQYATEVPPLIVTCNLNRMSMQRDYNVVIERDSDGYYIASVPSLPGCHTQAKSLDTLMKRIQEAIELCLEVEQAAETQLDFIGVQRVSVAI